MHQTTINDYAPLPAEFAWEPTTEVPDLSDAKELSIYCVIHDPLKPTRGSGARFKHQRGHIKGVALAVDGWNGYLTQSEALIALRKLTSVKCVIGYDLLYQLDYLQLEGIKFDSLCIDLQLGEVLLNEHRSSYYFADRAQERDISLPRYSLLDRWIKDTYPKSPKQIRLHDLGEVRGEVVGAFAQERAEAQLQFFASLTAELQEEKLFASLNLEARLMPLLLHMRWHGVKVDVPKAMNFSSELAATKAAYLLQLKQEIGHEVNVNSYIDLAKVYTSRGIVYPTTANDTPSFTKPWLLEQDDEVSKMVQLIRATEKIDGTFLRGYVFDHEINGRVHADFVQLRNESGEFGTRSRRFSCINPNLQNIPARDEILAPQVRSLFIPEEGQVWAQLDYSQIEFRILVHYARGQGAMEAREQYRTNNKTDYHTLVAEMLGVVRSTQVKNTNFAKVYRAGIARFALTAGIPETEARRIYDEYDRKLPFVRETGRQVERQASSAGQLITACGGKIHFPFWESTDWDEAKKYGRLSREEAVARFGRKIRRADTYKALNSLIQPSAAEVMKAGMVAGWEAGVFHILTCHLTVHDELDVSCPESASGRGALSELENILETETMLRVPTLIETKVGPDWGHVAKQQS